MEQYKALCLKLLGHYQYYGVRGNFKMLEVVFEHVDKAWRCWLSRRSDENFISSDVFDRLRRVFPLPRPRICHAV
jgi:RNA-directed DNA polymerase